MFEFYQRKKNQNYVAVIYVQNLKKALNLFKKIVNDSKLCLLKFTANRFDVNPFFT